MINPSMDPSLLQDFLTESAELIQQLDSDMVELETKAGSPEAGELLNRIFRALHTIKGAAGFLALTPVTHFAHAAEDALNRLRKGEVGVTSTIMDTLLESVDVVRGMIDELGSGREITPAPEALISQLLAISEQAEQVKADALPSSLSSPSSPAVPEPEPITAVSAGAVTQSTITLDTDKTSLLPYMAEDMIAQANNLKKALADAGDPARRGSVSSALADIATDLAKTADFFGLVQQRQIAELIHDIAPGLSVASVAGIAQVLPRLRGLSHLIELQAHSLEKKIAFTWPIARLAGRLTAAAAGEPLPDDAVIAAALDAPAVLAFDGVLPATAIAPTASREEPGSRSDPANAPTSTQANAPTSVQTLAPTMTVPAANARAAPKAPSESSDKPAASLVEQTIRVEVGRLEALLNLVGQLVLTKNRVLAMSRKAREHTGVADFLEGLAGAAGDLDRLTAELQVGVMRTRMQPLAKLFERYPRVIRDISRALDKRINLEVVGKETEVDKSVLELLADPLVHILRNAADHGVEMPRTRVAAGKPETGTIRLTAEHQGSHVRVEIADDGKGLDREVLLRKAVEKGMTTAEAGAQMSDSDVFRFIFAAGFSTAEKVTDLSGRGVGMDVVRTNISRMNGQVNVYSTQGRGTTIEILIPLTVAIMPAMVVGIGSQLYCVPLQSIVEIVRPEDAMVHSVSGQPVMRLRDSVLPLVNMRQRLGESGEGQGRFSVIVGVGGQRVGLMVDRLIGQQEIVIKPLDDKYSQGGPFSGATIREDGDVSLILDVIQLVRQTKTVPERAAA